MVNNLVFMWPKPLFFMVWGLMVYIYIYIMASQPTPPNVPPQK